MIEKITFLNSNWMWQICIAAGILWLIFIWKEWSSERKSRFWIHICIAFLGIISLMLIALQPALPISPTQAKTVILTDGYYQRQLDSLQEKYPKLEIISYKVNQQILEDQNTSDTIFVLGNGIQRFDLWQLSNHNVQYRKGDIPSGVIRYDYEHQNTIGKQLQLEGLYHHPQNGNRLIIEDHVGNNLDSISMISGTDQSFQLLTTLRASGCYTYSLTEKDSLGEILSSDPIPVNIGKQTSLNILILNDFPTFETKYLKNYLSEIGHQVLVKSQITKGKFKYEYFNRDAMPIGVLSKKNLESFDLLILDAITLRKLNKNTRQELKKSIREQGLGVFIQPDVNFLRSNEDIGTFDFTKVKTTETNIQGITKVSRSKFPFIFKEEFGLHLIHKSLTGNILSGYRYQGKGIVATTVLSNTYEMILGGDTDNYQQFWSTMIENIAKKEAIILDWDTNEVIAYKDEPYEFELRTSIQDAEVKTKEGYRIAMRQNIDVLNHWHGKTYPKVLGWNQLQVAQDTTIVHHYFVTDTSAWKSKRIFDRIKENTRYFDQSTVKKRKVVLSLAPINLIGLYILFLICIGYLWLEPKLRRELT